VRPPYCLVFGYGMKVSVPISQGIRFGNLEGYTCEVSLGIGSTREQSQWSG